VPNCWGDPPYFFVGIALVVKLIWKTETTLVSVFTAKVHLEEGKTPGGNPRDRSAHPEGTFCVGPSPVMIVTGSTYF